MMWGQVNADLNLHAKTNVKSVRQLNLWHLATYDGDDDYAFDAAAPSEAACAINEIIEKAVKNSCPATCWTRLTQPKKMVTPQQSPGRLGCTISLAGK